MAPSIASTEAMQPIPNSELLIIEQRLINKEVLSDPQRKRLVQFLQKFRLQGGTKPVMKNKKLQVNQTITTTSRDMSTQTDGLIPSPASIANKRKTDLEAVEQGKKLARLEKKDPRTVQQIMDASFDERRNFILIQAPIAKFVKDKYPLLFNIEEVKNELDRIFYKGKSRQFLHNIAKYSDIVAKEAPRDSTAKKLMQRIVSASRNIDAQQYAKEVGSLLILSDLIKEPHHYIEMDDTEKRDQSEVNFPYIRCKAKLSEIFYDKHSYDIFVDEKTRLCTAANFCEAILCLMAAHYIFDVRYPDSTFNTMGAFEKLLLEADETEEDSMDLHTKQLVSMFRLKAQVA